MSEGAEGGRECVGVVSSGVRRNFSLLRICPSAIEVGEPKRISYIETLENILVFLTTRQFANELN